MASLLFPVHLIAFSVIRSVRRNGGILSIMSFVLVFAAIAFTLTPPETYDLFRHYERIDSLKGLRFGEVIEVSEPGYILFHMYAWTINILGLPKQFFTASIVFVSYFLVFLVYLDFKKRLLIQESFQLRLTFFLILWLSIGFIMVAGGIRNGFANSIVLYVGYHLIYHNKTLTFLLGSVLATFMHPFAAAPLILIGVSRVLSTWSHYGRFCVLAAIVFIMIPSFSFTMTSLVGGLLEDFSFYKETYFREDSKWGGGFYETRPFLGLLVSFGIKRLPFYVALLYMLVKRPSRNDALYLFVCSLVLVAGFTFHLYAISGRVISILILFFCVYLVRQYLIRRSQVDVVFIYIYLFAVTLHSLFHVYEFAGFIFGSLEWLYKPLPIMLLGY